MEIQTIQRVKGDFNQTKIFNSQQSEQQEGTNKSYSQSDELTERTQSLTILFNNIIDLNFKEIIALYDQIDKKMFDHKLGVQVILAEFNKFDDVSQLENQRIVIHYYKNSMVVAGLILKTLQLVVIKQIKVRSQENLIYHLDEYKIHHRMNQLFPQQSLELIIPVRVFKTQEFYEIAACMERAQFNLYEYSRNHQIGDEEAMNIFVQILDQIINLHSVNIAHRDVKPQNIFYVKEKGWLLSDFGESLEYEEVDGLYNIRGTKYFLIPALQLLITKNGKYNQNLITNDIYALVVSMIMIQYQKYINDMQYQMQTLKNDMLKQIIKIKNLAQLIQFRGTIQFNKNKDLIDITKSFYQEMSAEQQMLNDKCNYISQMQYYQIQCSINTDPIWMQKILQLLQKNLKFMLLKFNFALGYIFMNLSFQKKMHLQLKLNMNWIKNIQNQPAKRQEFMIFTSFIIGYTQKTVTFASEYLKTHYSQSVHIFLIDSYFRANMTQEAEQQLKLFNEGMIFDQLNTNSQDKYLQYLQYLQEDQLKHNVQFDINIEQELQYKYKSPDDFRMKFLNDQLQFFDDSYRNKQIIVNAIIKELDKIFRDFNVLNINFCHVIFSYALNSPLYIHLPLIQHIYQQNYGQFDTNRKFTLLIQIAEIFILFNQRKEFMQNFKLIKQSVYESESWEQTICFKILYQAIFFMQYIFQMHNRKFNMNLIMKKFVNELKKISLIKFKCYFQFILSSLQNLINIIQTYQIYHKNHYLLYIIQFIINLALKHNLHTSEYDNYQIFHIQAQYILIDLKNDNRSKLLVSQQKKFLNIKATQVIREKKMDSLNLLIRPSIKKILKVQQLSKSEIQTIVRKESLYNRYLE